MIKPRRLLSCILLLLVCASSVVTELERNPNDLVPRLTTVAARNEKLVELAARQAELAVSADKAEFVQVTNEMVVLYLKLCDLESALQKSQESLAVAEKLAGSDQSRLLVDTLVLAARVNNRRNENPQAIKHLDRALRLSQQLEYRDGEAQARAQFGFTYYETNQRAQAKEMNDRALSIWRDLPNKPAEAQTLLIQGDVYMLDEEIDKAVASLKESEAIFRSLGDNVGAGVAIMDQAFLAIRQGQWQTALSFLNRVEALNVDKDAEPYLAGQIAMGFGLVYEAYGELENARTYLEASAKYYGDGAHDKRSAIDARTKLARVRAGLHDFTGARLQLQEALVDALATHNDLNIGLCHEDLGRVWLEASSYAPARTEFLAAIDYFSRSGEERPLARARIYLAQTEQLLGNLTQAADAYKKALPYFENNPDYTNEAALRFGLGKLALQQGRLKDAEENLARSIELTGRLREYAWSPDLRSSFLASVHARFQSYVELLMIRSAQEHDRQLEIRAFEASEAGRARALIDSLHDLRELRQPSDPSLFAQEKALQQEEQKLIDAQARLISQAGTKAELDAIDKDLAVVRAKYEAVEARINDSSTSLVRPTSLTYDEIRKEVTDSSTSLLSFSLGAEKSYAWLVTQDGLYSFQLSSKTIIDNAAKQLLELLQSPATDQPDKERLQAAIDQLSQLVLEPLSNKLQTPRLIVVADGFLQYIPFQILKASANASEPLISQFDIVEAPSASALALVRRQHANAQQFAPKLLVGFGDAVFSPNYLPRGAKAADNQTTADLAQTRSEELSKLNQLPRLFHARRELTDISELTGNNAAFYSEYDATREKLRTIDLSQYRILHVVTHGLFDTERPERSGLVLSLVNANQQPIPGFVSLADIYKLRAPKLVVLSACYTALGQKLEGEGLTGVTRGFMHAGASGVVATLWQVNDRASAELMKNFYENMLRRDMTPAAALRDAQNKIRLNPNWSSPYYWAGFTYQGDYDLRIKSATPINVNPYGRFIAAGPLFLLLLGGGYWYLRRRQRKA